MQSIQPGGGGDINALLTGLERALDLMPMIKERPELLSQLECLKALIWLRLMRIPASKIREPSPPDGLLEVSEAAKRLGVSTDDLYRYAKPGMVA
jgi:hypothetical protein